jgi:hypothetical protein
VLIGRSTLYGTAAAGEAGARRALEIYRSEISRTMAQIACNRVSEIGPQHVAFQNEWLVGQSSAPAPHARAMGELQGTFAVREIARERVEHSA